MVIILDGQHGPIVVKLAVGVQRRVQEPAQIPYHSTVEKNCSKLGPASQTVNCSTDPCRE